MNLTYIAKALVLTGAIILILGGILWLASKTGISWGRLPGDVNVSSEKGSFYFPVMTSIVLSIVLTALINFLMWIFRK